MKATEQDRQPSSVSDLTVSERLGTFIASTPFDALPPNVVERAKISLAHNLAVALAGRSRESVAHEIACRAYALPAEATLLTSGRRVSVEGAAFANAALMHARSQDDTLARSTSHPGSPSIGAALALAQALGCSGADLLRAVVLGYEALGRVGNDVDHLVTARGYRAAAVFGVFGATAAAASLLRLTGEQTAHALGLATHMAGGTAQVWVEGTAEGTLQLGFSARNGIMAARAAQAGATAARAAFEGRSGLFRTLAGAEPMTAAQVTVTLGAVWQIEEATVKPFPACAILQGPIAVLLDLLRTRPIPPHLVATIALELSPFEASYPGVDNAGPFGSAIATKLSAQFCLALALQTGRVTSAGLQAFDDAAVLSLARTVRVIADPALEPRLSRLTVTMADGQTMSTSVRVPVGQPNFAEIDAFVRDLSPEMGMEPDHASRLVAALRELEFAPNVDALLGALFPAGLTG